MQPLPGKVLDQCVGARVGQHPLHLSRHRRRISQRGPARDIEKLFHQVYRGSRYSFGYPACPRLEDQEPLLRILGAERIGLTLTDEYMLNPEQSTSALVVHHPEAKYFNV